MGKNKLAWGLMLALLMLAFTAVTSFAAADRIGFIEPHRVLVSHPKYEETQKQIDAYMEKKTSEARAAAEKETDAAKRMEIIEAARRESGEENVRVMNPISQQINDAIEKAAKAKGVSVVLSKMVIYFGGVDLTDDVIKVLKELK